MRELVADAAAELVSVVLYAALAGLLTAAGLLGEQAGLASVASGQTAVGLWYLYMGGLGLYAGLYLLGYRTAWLRFRGVLADDSPAG
ncbi:MAG: hypothetical protein ABEJ92_01315 [Halobacteriales archaeon]